MLSNSLYLKNNNSYTNKKIIIKKILNIIFLKGYNFLFEKNNQQFLFISEDIHSFLRVCSNSSNKQYLNFS